MKPNLTSNPSETLKPEWAKAIGIIARNILEEQSPMRLKKIRDMVYELLVNCIPGDLIMKTLCDELIVGSEAIAGDEIKPKIVKWTAFYENKLQ